MAVAAGVAFGCLMLDSEGASAITGDLSTLSCVSGDTATGPAGTDACALAGTDPAAGGGGSGLDSPEGIAVSPDGTSVYVASVSDAAIVHFQRNAAGALTFTGCITGEIASGPIGTGACAAGPVTTAGGVNSGFQTPQEVAVSANGADVYMTTNGDSSVIHFDRNTTTGQLTFSECLTGETGSTIGSGSACIGIPGASGSGAGSGLEQVSGIAVAGADVYVTGQADDAIAELNRVPATGVISWDDCVSGNTTVTGCTAAPDATATGSFSGMHSTHAPSVSDDGDYVYLGGSEDAAVVWFDRGPAGNLTFNDCVTGSTNTGPAGTGACSATTPNPTASGIGSGMHRSQSLAISGDDETVYVGSQSDDAVTTFDRNAGTGDLTFAACIGGDTDVAACTHVAEASTTGIGSGFNAVQSLAISPDGKSLYAAAASDSSVITFDRALADGVISLDRCVSGDTAAGPSGTGACEASPVATANGTASGLRAVPSIVMVPDGSGLLGTADVDDSVFWFTRTVAPDTTLLTGPGTLTNDSTPTFTFSSDEPGATFQCRIDGGTISPCSGTGTHTTAALSDGSHTFEVRARNDVPTPDPTPASTTFTVDTTAPQTTISSGPNGAIASRDAQFTFDAPGSSSFACRIDGGAFSACTSPRSFAGLSEGSHTFEVRATDAAGNTDASPASQSFSVDTTGPALEMSKKPKKKLKLKSKSKKAKVKVKFVFAAADASATFECSVDKGKAFKPCDSPCIKKYKKGKHTVSIRAVDGLGNVGSEIATKFKVKPRG